MARDPKLLRKAYEYKLGKDLTDKLTDAHIESLSNYYNRATPEEQSDIDSELAKGMGDFLDTARQLANEGYVADPKLEVQKYKSVTDRKDIYRPGDKVEDNTKEKGGSISTIVREAKRTSYQETDTDKAVENIDPEILKLLGLEDTTDFDYGEYKTLLKEQMMAGRMRGTQMSSEDTERLTNEFKRVKSSTGKFVINSNNVGKTVYKPRSYSRGESGEEQKDVTALLEGSKETNNEQDEKISSILTTIPDSIESIAKVLQNVNNILGVSVAVEEDDLEAKQQKDLQAERDAEEKAREGAGKKLGFKMPKLPKPKIPFMDRIKQFFGNVLMGGVAVALLEWIQDPDNQEAIDNFVDFIVDKGPLILGGILALMALPIAGTMISLTASVLGLAKGLLVAAAGVKVAIGGLALLAAGLVIPKLLPESVNEQERAIDQAEGSKEEKIRQLEEQLENLSFFDRLRGVDREIEEQIYRLKTGKTKAYGQDFGQAGDPLYREGEGPSSTERQVDKDNEMYGDTVPEGSFGITQRATPSDPSRIRVSPQTPAIPTATGMGQQGTTQTVDYGIGGDAGPKGYIIVPGHAAGGGAPGEMELTPELSRNIVENVRKRVGDDAPIRVMDMHSSTDNTDAAFRAQQDKLKKLEDEGYEVIEIHMDASIESGYGTGRGVIPPMPGTDEINPVEADFARTSGSFSRTHRGGLAGTNRGVSLIELGNMSPQLQKQVLEGDGLSKDQLDQLTKPLEDSLIRGMGSTRSLPETPPPAPILPPPPDQQVSSRMPPRPPGSPSVTVVAAATQTGGSTSGTQRRNSQIPSIGAVDQNNDTVTITKSVYNLIA